MRANLNEKDHPINVIVQNFQKIILDNVEQIKYKFRFTQNLAFNHLGATNKNGFGRERSVSNPEVVEINHTSMGLENDREILR